MDNRLPIYFAELNEETQGIDCISFVEKPAMEVNLMKFSKQDKQKYYSVLDNVHHRVIAPICRCNFPIYRKDSDLGEYYIIYDKQTIEKIAKKMLEDGKLNRYNIEHQSFNKLDGIYYLEIFIKDSNKGINPTGFEDIENGSLFGVFDIENPQIWEKVENADNIGISFEGYFDLALKENDNIEDADIEEYLTIIQNQINYLKQK